MIAALFVETKGCYQGLPNVDPWDIHRDAMLYDGPHPVVAHPPCARWCQMAAMVEAVYGYKKGDDGGTFASALASVRKWGGVLEHPANTAAFAAHGLARPPRRGWQRDMCGGWSCQVSQAAYEHRAQKMTWLYAYGCELPTLKWGKRDGTAYVSFANYNNGKAKVVERMGRRDALSTPHAFRDLLIAMAETANGAQK